MIFWLFSIAFAQPHPTERLSEARKAYLQGDRETTIAITQQLLKNKKVYGTTKDAVRYLLASAYTQSQAHLLAAEQYQKIYWGGRALKKEALFARAKSLSKGDAHKSVLSSCSTFRKKWPNEGYSDSCLLLMGKAHGELGNISNMRYFYEQYLSKNPKSPKGESIRVQEALFEYQNKRRGAKEKLRYYFFNHSYPSSAAQIKRTLEPEDIIPQNLQEETQYIWSLIKSGFLEEAWEHTQRLQEDEETRPDIQSWMRDNLTQIAWYTRAYDTYIERRTVEYEKDPTGLLAWKIFHAHTRAGQWKEAGEWGDAMLVKYKRRGRWAGAKDDVARSHMFNRNYKRAAELWSQKRGTLAQFNTAFCTYMSGDLEEAIALFEKLSDRTDAWGVASNYWIGKSKEKRGEDPSTHFEFVRTHDTVHWYRLLLTQQEDLPTPETTVFNGQWKQKNLDTKQRLDGALRQDLLTLASPKSSTKHLPTYTSSFSWNEKQSPSFTSLQKPQKTEYSTHPYSGSSLPSSYDNLPFSSDEELKKGFLDFVQRKGGQFPVLKEIYALSLAGNYPIAAHKLNILYEDWGKETADSKMRSLIQKELEWLPHMIFTRAHHHVMRFTTLSAQKKQASPAMQQLNFPIVHPHYVWSLAKKYNLDPFLIHSILRAESTYQEFVVSWAGAIGYVQVMPKTGAKVAHLLNEETYSPEDLEIPKINLRYGSFYFSRLMERFDQSYPFAVGSYNGGPHNMSRWYKNLKGNVDMDEFVEHISFDETRRYVKKVCGYYGKYISFHHPNGIVRLPLTPGEDDASVIDF